MGCFQTNSSVCPPGPNSESARPSVSRPMLSNDSWGGSFLASASCFGHDFWHWSDFKYVPPVMWLVSSLPSCVLSSVVSHVPSTVVSCVLSRVNLIAGFSTKNGIKDLNPGSVILSELTPYLPFVSSHISTFLLWLLNCNRMVLAIRKHIVSHELEIPLNNLVDLYEDGSIKIFPQDDPSLWSQSTKEVYV